MFVMVKDYLPLWTTITSKWTAFAALYAAFETVVGEIFIVSGQQDDNNKGVTQTKSQLRTALIELMLEISEKCSAHATIADDLEFLSLTKFSKGSLVRMADADLVKTAETLNTNVLPKLSLIAEYDLKQTDLDQLVSTNSDFISVYTKPNSLRKETAQLTARLSQLFETGDNYLLKLDAMIQSARAKEPAFVNEYLGKRKLVKSATRTRALQLWVVDDATGEPFAKAKVKISSKAGADLQKSVKSTGPKGGMTQAIMEAGEYNYEVTFGGFTTGNGSFFINDGVMTEVIVRMKRA